MPDEWQPWNSRGAQPVPDHVMVEVTLRNKHVHVGTAAQLSRNYQGREIGWRHVGDKFDIVAWRLPSPPPSEEEHPRELDL